MHARVVAVRVVVGGRLAEVAEPADEVGRVGPQEVDHRLALAHRRDRAAERRAADPLQLRQVLHRVGRVVERAGLRDDRAEVLERRRRLVEQRARTRGRISAAAARRRFEALQQRVEVVERRAQVDERRVALAQRVRQHAERLRERVVLGRDRAHHRVEVRRSARSARARFCATAPVTLAPATSARSSVSWSRASSFTSWSVVDRNGLKYFADSLTFSPCPSYCAAEPWKYCCRPLRVLGSSVLKSWSRSTTEVVCSTPSCPPSGISGALFGPGRRARCSGSRRPTARSGGSSRSCPRAAARTAPRP